MANNDDHDFTGEAEILKRAADEYERSNPDFGIDARKTALLVIDLQEGFVAEGARMWTPQNLRILPGVKQLIERCRALSVPIIFTEHVHDASGRDRLANRGSWSKRSFSRFWPSRAISGGLFNNSSPSVANSTLSTPRQTGFNGHETRSCSNRIWKSISRISYIGRSSSNGNSRSVCFDSSPVSYEMN